MKLSLPRGELGKIEYTTVKHRKTDDNNLPIGTANKWSLLDLRKYEVEYTRNNFCQNNS